MYKTNPTAAYTLTYIIAALALTAACGGLLNPDLYRDNAFVSAV
jgi:hypothetical protein